MLEGSFKHEDFCGHKGTITPGDLQVPNEHSNTYLSIHPLYINARPFILYARP